MTALTDIFYKNLLSVKAERGFNWEYVAESGISRQNLVYWRKNEGAMPLSKAKTLADKVGVNLPYLFGLCDDKEPMTDSKTNEFLAKCVAESVGKSTKILAMRVRFLNDNLKSEVVANG